MTLPDRFGKAMSGALVSGGVTVTVQSPMEAAINVAYEARLVCIVESCEQRSVSLRGIYNITGKVTVLQSIDVDDPEGDFRLLCTTVRDLMGGETTTPASITSQDPSIHIYNRSWHLDDLGIDAGDRGFKAEYSWRAVVRDTISTN